MNVKSMRVLAAIAAGGVAMAALAAASAADASDQLQLTPVAKANTKAPGLTSPNRLSPELAQIARAQGSTAVENPQDGVGYYGYDSIDNSPSLLPVVGAGGASLTEAHKTEPDKNTYLVLRGQDGADPSYDYGSHFLYQGHEAGTPGYVSRINLDADSTHRVHDPGHARRGGTAIAGVRRLDLEPFAKRLLMTSENGCLGGVWAGDANYAAGSTFTELPALGKGGFEGIQTASDGSIWIVEDVGGATIAARMASSPTA